LFISHPIDLIVKINIVVETTAAVEDPHPKIQEEKTMPNVSLK